MNIAQSLSCTALCLQESACAATRDLRTADVAALTLPGRHSRTDGLAVFFISLIGFEADFVYFSQEFVSAIPTGSCEFLLPPTLSYFLP